mgnify:CR=1 FL=1|tara:strand:- start:946 stop:1707 length:762 start_codon:yes stop_codon:yes gene_type:complete
MIEALEKFKDDEAYYADKEYLSNSMLKLLRQSPTKFYLMRQGKWSYPSASFFDVGTALHALFLEGVDKTLLWNGTRRGNDYKEFKLAHTDKLILPKKDYDTVHYMYDKLNKLKEVEQLMGEKFKPEVPGIMEHTTESFATLKFKGKADALCSSEGRTYLVDLKTTAKSLEDFKKSARWMFYNQQAYLYSRIFGVDDFYFLVIEKEFPYEVGIFKASDEFLHSGGVQFNTSVSLYEELFLNQKFNPYNVRYGEL